MMRKLIAAAAGGTLLVSGLAAWTSAGSARAEQRPTTLRPVIFVHGGSGSGAQYEAPARRFASNGYPAHHVEAHDDDSTLERPVATKALGGDGSWGPYRARHRGCSGPPDVINVPNLASSRHRLSLQFNDYCTSSRRGKGGA